MKTNKLEIWQEDFTPCVNCGWYECRCNGKPFMPVEAKKYVDRYRKAKVYKTRTSHNRRIYDQGD